MVLVPTVFNFQALHNISSRYKRMMAAALLQNGADQGEKS
jgi:hypothetical protein